MRAVKLALFVSFGFFLASLALPAANSDALAQQTGAATPQNRDCKLEDLPKDCVEAMREGLRQGCVVLCSPEPPRVPVTRFKAEELKGLSCQPLTHLRYYIYYSFGICVNKDPMFGKLFFRSECVNPGEARNKQALQTVASDLYKSRSVVRGTTNFIRKIENEKGCRLEDEPDQVRE